MFIRTAFASFLKPSRLGMILLMLSVQFSCLSVSVLHDGSISTRLLIVPRTSSSVSNTPSTLAVFSLTYSAVAVSSLTTLFSSNALGLFTKSFAPSFVMNVKSVSVGIRAAPPPHVPKIAVICGITPDANDCLRYTSPNALSASVASCNLKPAQSTRPITGAPIFIAMS